MRVQFHVRLDSFMDAFISRGQQSAKPPIDATLLICDRRRVVVSFWRQETSGRDSARFCGISVCRPLITGVICLSRPPRWNFVAARTRAWLGWRSAGGAILHECGLRKNRRGRGTVDICPLEGKRIYWPTKLRLVLLPFLYQRKVRCMSMMRHTESDCIVRRTEERRPTQTYAVMVGTVCRSKGGSTRVWGW